jgi:hypothetical protein
MSDPKKPRRPIDMKRDGAGTFSIDEPGAKIEEMLVIDDAMIIVSTKSVHRSVLADQIDPDRTDFNLPQMVQQKIIGYGSEAHFIAQTLVVARALFDTTHLGQGFKKDEALSFTLRAAKELSAAADIFASLESDQAAGIQKLDSALKGSSLSLPTIANLQSRVSSYINHLRSACLALVGIVQLFYPKAKNNDGWRLAFDKGVQPFLEKNPQFAGTTQFLCDFIERMSDMRNAMEHPDKSKSGTATDFCAVPGGGILKPRLVINFKNKKIVDSEIDYFMKLFLDKTGEVFEDMCALLCDANIVPFGPIETRVASEQPNNSLGPRNYRYLSQFKDGFQLPPQKSAT